METEIADKKGKGEKKNTMDSTHSTKYLCYTLYIDWLGRLFISEFMEY
jgi:hypothetical protein